MRKNPYKGISVLNTEPHQITIETLLAILRVLKGMELRYRSICRTLRLNEKVNVPTH